MDDGRVENSRQLTKVWDKRVSRNRCPTVNALALHPQHMNHLWFHSSSVLKTYLGLLWQVRQTKGQDQSMSCWWDSLVPKKPKFWSIISKGEHTISHSRIKVVAGTVSNTAIRLALPYVCPHLATMASSINVPLQQNLTQPQVLIRPHSIQNSQNKTSKETI